jgi:hypothetical protein
MFCLILSVGGLDYTRVMKRSLPRVGKIAVEASSYLLTVAFPSIPLWYIYED